LDIFLSGLKPTLYIYVPRLDHAYSATTRIPGGGSVLAAPKGPPANTGGYFCARGVLNREAGGIIHPQSDVNETSEGAIRGLGGRLE